MIRIIASLVLMSMFLSSSAQYEKGIYVGNVISDTSSFNGPSLKYGMPPIMLSENKIEVRFITSPYYDNASYVVLTFNKEWNATYYHLQPIKDSLKSRDITATIKIDSVFSLLVDNNIFSLPNHGDLELNKYEYFPETNEFSGSGMGVGHAINYTIEFKVGPLYRRYSYYAPQEYADFYPQFYELRKFSNIVEIFGKLRSE